MRTPICELCLKSGILCPRCQEKIKNNEIRELDIIISKALYELASKRAISDSFTFIKSLEFKEIIIIIVGQNEVGTIVGRGGRNIRTLQHAVKKKIRVIEETKDLRKIMSDLIYPARILGINTLFFQDGTTKKKFRIHKEEKKMPVNIKSIKQIIAALTGEHVEIVLE